MEKEIELEQEAIVVYSGGGAVNSVNGYTGDVVLTTSDLENTSDYQTGTEVESAISTAIAGKQDALTAGNNITISNNTISATDTTYSAGTGLTLNGTQFSVDTSTIATQQDVSDEATARENADINLQGQIDAISAASDVTDIVGTYADLQAYDTQHLKDNDIIKVLQDESQNDETTYYRWSTSTQTFTLIGEEGPYYTKSQTDTLLQAKQDTLTAGSNITIGADNTISATDTTYTAGTNVSISSGNVISATDTTYTAGTGLSLNGTEFSADTSVLATQTDLSGKQDTLTAGSNITISGDTISATDTTYSAFTGTDGTAAGTAGLVPAPATTDAGKYLKADGTWDTVSAGPTVVQTTGNSQTDVMSQNAVTSMVFGDPTATYNIRIGRDASTSTRGVAIGRYAKVSGNESVAIGGCNNDTYNTEAQGTGSLALGARARATTDYATAIGSNSTTSTKGEVSFGGTDLGTNGYNSSNYRLLTNIYDPQSAHDAATKGYVDSIAIQNAGAPTTSTVGTVGQLLEDTTNGKLYICTAVSGSTYTWTEVGAGGGGVTLYNTTVGENTDGAPTQKAVAESLYYKGGGSYSSGSINIDPGATRLTKSMNNSGSIYIGLGATTYVSGWSNQIAIGHTAKGSSEAVSIGFNAGPTVSAKGSNGVYIGPSAGTSANYTVSIGRNSSTSANGSIALGAYSSASSVGEMNIGSSETSYGYNSSNYRLLTGVYDPQSAHDAATKGYVDPTTDSSAPTTATVGRLGQIQIDTATATAYMCVAVDTVTPAYTWKQITA